MKTIIIEAQEKSKDLTNFIQRIEHYADRTIKGAVVCTRLLDANTYNTVCGELRDAENLDDFDLFIIGICCPQIKADSVHMKNRTKCLSCTLDDIEQAKNFIVSL